MNPDDKKPVPDPITYDGDVKIIDLTDEISPLEGLQRDAWEKAGIVKGYREIGKSLLAKILISKELYSFTQGFEDPEVLDGIMNTRDGLYLVLAKNGELKWFGGTQFENVEPAIVEKHWAIIEDEEEFYQRSEMVERALKKRKEELGGSIVSRKEIEGGLMMQIMGETLFLILKDKKGNIVKFGKKQAKGLKPEDIEAYYQGIQNTEEFYELSTEMEQMYELKEFENMIEKANGAITDCRKVEGGLMAKVIMPQSEKADNQDEVLSLVLKNGNRELSYMGGGQFHKITGEEVKVFFKEIISADHFKTVSEMFEIVRGSPKLLPAKGETTKPSKEYSANQTS